MDFKFLGHLLITKDKVFAFKANKCLKNKTPANTLVISAGEIPNYYFECNEKSDEGII